MFTFKTQRATARGRLVQATSSAMNVVLEVELEAQKLELRAGGISVAPRCFIRVCFVEKAVVKMMFKVFARFSSSLVDVLIKFDGMRRHLPHQAMVKGLSHALMISQHNLVME